MTARKLIPLLAMLVGCSSIPTISELPATVTIKFGHDVQITQPDVVIRFAEVVQDSRCPVDVTCVQQGSATLRFTLIEPDQDQFSIPLETGGLPYTIEGLTFRLISVDPEPHSGHFLDPANYTATIEITSAQ
jgi:hypothetical protein